MELNKIIHNDCIEALKTLPENSIDSIVTDPPYELKFMNKKWDGTGIAYNVGMWKECLRVLKPGGHLLSFGGTRTYHRMACAIEDAGFEIRDQIQWLYGCYSEDTECLTRNGFKKYYEIECDDEILQWNSLTNELSWYKPEEILSYDYIGDMFTFKNRHTDQLLTPNHRVYAKIRKHSRDNSPTNFEIMEASKLKKHWMKDFPLAGELKTGTYVEHSYLIGWWLTDAWVHGDGKACMFSQSKTRTLNKLKNYLDKNNVIYSEYVKNGKEKRHQDEHTFYVTGEYAKYLLKKFPYRELTWDVMLWDYNSRFNLVEGLLDGDGTRSENGERGYSEVFWSKNINRLDVFQAVCCSLNIRSHIDYKKGCVYLNRNCNSSQLQNKHYTEPEKYNGKVWCLKTETGAFVVRRNGKVFISGNSGFPKSYNISKGIDKKLGKEREVIGFSSNPNGNSKGYEGERYSQKRKTKFGIVQDQPVKTAPASEQSQYWDGWGTALKPANEPIVLARKPLSEKTIVDNVLKWDTGGINIDESRIRFINPNEDTRRNARGGENGLNETSTFKIREWKADEQIKHDGRFPANVILDEEAVTIVDEQSGTLKSGKDAIRQKEGFFVEHGGLGKAGDVQITYGDSGGASRFFYCAKASKKEKGKYNNHPTVKPLKLMEYLVNLVTPKDGIVLDPFVGSGSTLVAAKNKGFNYIGIEKEDEYIEIAKKRLNEI